MLKEGDVMFMTYKNGKYGVFGGRYVPETLMNELERLDGEYGKINGTASLRRN